jgi:hypothetical protein
MSEGLTLFRMITASIRITPHFIIIGGQRCGTTSLFNYLVQHPCIIPATKKEVHYFDLNYSKNKGWYRAHFPSLLYMIYMRQKLKHSCLTFEASPYYIFHPAVSKRVAETLPEVKLLALLRNPVDRAYSHYHFEVKLGNENLSFEDAIDREKEWLDSESNKLLNGMNYYSFKHQHYSYLSRGIYVEQLKRWVHYFRRQNLMIIETNELYNDPACILKRLSTFLDISDWQLQSYPKHNRLNYPRMNPNTRKLLIDYFSSSNQSLYDFLGSSFDWT